MAVIENTTWVLPTHKQLRSLLWDKHATERTLCPCKSELKKQYSAIFESPHDWYWTSSINKAQKVKVIDFRDGFSGYCSAEPHSNNKGRVRLVSNVVTNTTWHNGMPAEQRYALLKNNEVIDRKTGLIWQRVPSEKQRYRDVIARLISD